jgi:hypothetical protein
MRFLKGGIAILTLAAAAAAGVAAGQANSQQQNGQDDTLAAAARQAREEKKAQLKTVKVWDNDNIPRNPGSLSVIGSDSQQAASDSSATGDNKQANTPEKNAKAAAEKKSGLEADLAAAKEDLQNLQSDFDIMQRKLALDQQTYMSKPNYSADKAGASSLNDEQAQLDAKQQDMETANKKVADLQAQLNALAEAKPESK